ncbi:enoyl-CoA hydratase [Blastococcus sp. SYSU D00820]
MPSDQPVTYAVDGAVAVISLNRPEKRNAQNLDLLYRLDEAFVRAVRDDAVTVVVLRAEGPDFSSGHDLLDDAELADFPLTSSWGGFDLPGAEGWMAREYEIYLGLSMRWRNLPKPTIAAVQGRVIAGGLMLVWPCDLIVAAEDARFRDPTVAMGVNGVEMFNHPWELGVRKAKEMLFTGDWVDARTAEAMGMVNQVVPPAELDARVMDLARRIAGRSRFGLKLAKQAVNQMQDAQGYWTAQQAAMALQQLGHTHNLQQFGDRVDPSGFPTVLRGKDPEGRSTAH